MQPVPIGNTHFQASDDLVLTKFGAERVRQLLRAAISADLHTARHASVEVLCAMFP